MAVPPVPLATHPESLPLARTTIIPAVVHVLSLALALLAALDDGEEPLLPVHPGARVDTWGEERKRERDG